MVHRSFRLLGKYALLLSLFYALETVSSKFLSVYSADMAVSEKVLMRSWPILFFFVLNIVTTLVVSLDIRKLKIKTSYIIIATLLFRQIGVCAFLLYAIYDEYEEMLREKQTA